MPISVRGVDEDTELEPVLLSSALFTARQSMCFVFSRFLRAVIQLRTQVATAAASVVLAMPPRM